MFCAAFTYCPKQALTLNLSLFCEVLPLAVTKHKLFHIYILLVKERQNESRDKISVGASFMLCSCLEKTKRETRMKQAEEGVSENGVSVIADVIAGCWFEKYPDDPISFHRVRRMLRQLEGRGFCNNSEDTDLLASRITQRICIANKVKSGDSVAVMLTKGAKNDLQGRLGCLSKSYESLVSATKRVVLVVREEESEPYK